MNQLMLCRVVRFNLSETEYILVEMLDMGVRKIEVSSSKAFLFLN